MASVVGEALVRRLSRVGQLSVEDCALLLDILAEVRIVRRHREVRSVMTGPGSIVILLDGLLHRHMTLAEGARQTLSLYLPDDIAGLEMLHLERPIDGLGAVVDSHVGLIPVAALRQVLAGRAGLIDALWRETVVQGLISRAWLMRNSRLPAHSAMAHLFCEIYLRSAAAGRVSDGACAFPVTQELLAEALGLTSVHVNRTLQTLRETGALDHRAGRLFVYDLARLTSVAGFTLDYLNARAT